jgi:hypothetical protein
MSARVTRPHVGVYLHPVDGPSDAGEVADAIEAYFAARSVRPSRITSEGKTVAFKPGRLRALAAAERIHALTVWVEGSRDTADAHAYLRPFNVNDQRFQTREIDLVWTSEQTAIDEPLLTFLRTIVGL